MALRARQQLGAEGLHHRDLSILSPQKVDFLRFLLLVHEPPVATFEQGPNQNCVVALADVAFVVVQHLALLRYVVSLNDF